MHFVFKRASFFIVPLILILIFSLAISYLIEHKKNIFFTKKVEKVVSSPKKELKIVPAKIGVSPKIEPATLPSSIPTVVIDPAHGGEDTGFIGYRGAEEAQSNLQFAFMLAKELRMKGVRVYLTRMEDKNLSLDKRIDFVKQVEPLLYVSINCAYSSIKTIKGMEIFSFTSEQDGDEFENLENSSYEAYEGRYLPKTENAIALEQRISREIKRGLDLPYKSALERKFLKQLAIEPQVAGISIFIGYISNPEDVKKISNLKLMDSTAQSIAGAIDKGLSLSMQH